MDTFLLVICAIASSIVYLYFWLKNLYSYFERNGVPHVKPIPFFGNTIDLILMRRHLPIIQQDIHNQLEPHPFGGIFVGTEKRILIRDPELIKTILVRDFSHFHDRHIESDKNDVLSENLFFLRGDKWKNLRIKLTGTFTPGKMKMMFPLVRDCGLKLHQVLDCLSHQPDFDAKDVCARFVTDAIGSCVFGLEINSLDNPDSLFRKMGSKFFEFSFANTLGVMFPRLRKCFRSFRTDEDMKQFYLGLVKKTVQYREEYKVVRGDFLDLLIQLKHDTEAQKLDDHQARKDLETFIRQTGGQNTKGNVDMTVGLMAAQCFIFFTAGFETSSTMLSCMLLELAQNQHVQQKLRNEILRVLKNNDNELTYESMKQMKYLDMVMEETLRKYSISGSLNRGCNKPYKIPGSQYVVPEGATVTVSIRGIHNDSKYYERPQEFYPEHFTDEAKSKRPPFTFLPFGRGPRACIGERFARMLAKVAAVNLMKDFSYSVSPNLKLPLIPSPGVGSFHIEGGVWLKCKKI